MKLIYAFISTLMIALPAQAVQLYQWKDAQGHVFYSDQPPPPTVKNATKKNFKGNLIEGGESYALKRAREKSPVTLFSGACGAPCDLAKRHLEQRGIPYTNKNPESGEDRAALQKLTGRLNVPVLQVGTSKIDGYEVGQWDAALDVAGYPKAGDLIRKSPLQNPGKPTGPVINPSQDAVPASISPKP
jgi:glutaredoxin